MFFYVTNITKDKQQYLSKLLYILSSDIFSLPVNDSKIDLSGIFSLSVNDSQYLMQHKLLLQLNNILYFIIGIAGES